MEDTLTQDPPVQDPPSKKLWQSLYNDKLYSKPYDEFRSQFNTPESIGRLHKSLSEENLYTKPESDFQQQFFSDVKKKSTPSDGGSPSFLTSLQSISQLGLSKKQDKQEQDTPFDASVFDKINVKPISDNTYKEKPISEIDIQEGLARNEQHKKDMQTAIDNTTQKALKNKGINATKGSSVYEEQRKKIEEKTKPFIVGGVVVNGAEATFHKDKNGNIGLDRNLGWFEGIGKGFNDAVNGEDEANAFSNMATEQKVEYANKQMQEKPPTEYMQERNGVGGLIGGAIPYTVKAATAGVVASAATIAAPETGGLSLAGAAPVLTLLLTAPDMIKQGAKDEVLSRYMQLKQERPVEDETQLMKIAEQGEISGSLLGAANSIAFLTTLKLPILNEGKSVLKSYLNNVASSAVHLGAITAGGKALQLADRKIEGYNVDTDKAVKEIATTFSDNATAGVVLSGLIGGAHVLPKLVKSAFKFALKDTPTSEISTVLKANEDAGRIPKGIAENIVADINGYKEALGKINPNGLSEQSQASIAGLIQAKDNLTKESATKDEAVRKPYQDKIEVLNTQIADIVRTNKPFEHELDDVTGNTIAKPSFDDVAKQRVEDIADKISKGKSIDDVIDSQTEAKFPEQLTKQLEKILREEKAKNKDKENPDNELTKNINRYLEQNNSSLKTKNDEKTNEARKTKGLQKVDENGNVVSEGTDAALPLEIKKSLDDKKDSHLMAGYKNEDGTINHEAALKDIADQAQNISNGKPVTPENPNAYELMVKLLGGDRKLVDAAIERYPVKEADVVGSEGDVKQIKIDNDFEKAVTPFYKTTAEKVVNQLDKIFGGIGNEIKKKFIEYGGYGKFLFSKDAKLESLKGKIKDAVSKNISLEDLAKISDKDTHLNNEYFDGLKNQYDNLQKTKNSLEAVKKELEKESLNKERGLPLQKDFYPIYDIIENMYRTYGMEQPKFLAEMSLNELLDEYSKLDKYIKTKESDLKDKYTSAVTTRLITDDFKPNVNEQFLKAVEQSLPTPPKADVVSGDTEIKSLEQERDNKVMDEIKSNLGLNFLDENEMPKQVKGKVLGKNGDVLTEEIIPKKKLIKIQQDLKDRNKKLMDLFDCLTLK